MLLFFVVAPNCLIFLCEQEVFYHILFLLCSISRALSLRTLLNLIQITLFSRVSTPCIFLLLSVYEHSKLSVKMCGDSPWYSRTTWETSYAVLSKYLQKRRTLCKYCLAFFKLFDYIKRFKILSDRYRNRRKRFLLRFNLICGICNFDRSF